jgi:hypothetical protein
MLEVKLLYFSFMSLGFPSAFLLFLLRKPKLKTQAKASGCQLLSGNKAFLVERSFHGAAKSLRAARASYYRSYSLPRCSGAACTSKKAQDIGSGSKVSVVCIPWVIMPLSAERWGSRPMA